jgi:hypothetical protein
MIRLMASFIVGVYIGQEYYNIPRIKIIGEALYEKLLSLDKKSNDRNK